MILDKMIAGQTKHPHGIFSSIVVHRMNNTNVNINNMTVQLMQIGPADRVLEIGFGGGEALNEMIKLIQSGLLAGIEISDAMIKRCRKRFGSDISRGKMELKKGRSDKIPYEDGFFDKVCVINCIYFWSNPTDDLKEILRVMKNRAKLVISAYTREMIQKHSFARYGYTFYTDSQLQDLLDKAGFSDIRIERRENQPIETILTLATKR
jgi:ubiquinone/menaquinone biosynthesis C-methylase UbiE